MARIFFALALFAVVLLGVNFVLGLRIGDYQQAAARMTAASRGHTQAQQNSTQSGEHRDAARRELIAAATEFKPLQRRKNLHFMFGIAASLVTLLVNGVAITYFVGTSRWCREVVETYGLDLALAQRSARLKRRTFPWAVVGMLTIVGIAALGAASDPAASQQSAQWVTMHFTCALLGAALIAWSFLVQVGNVGANYEVIEEILAEVKRVRAERGLDEEKTSFA